MKITIIHGQSHQGSTCNIARLLAKKLNGEVEVIDKKLERLAQKILKQQGHVKPSFKTKMFFSMIP